MSSLTIETIKCKELFIVDNENNILLKLFNDGGAGQVVVSDNDNNSVIIAPNGGGVQVTKNYIPEEQGNYNLMQKNTSQLIDLIGQCTEAEIQNIKNILGL